MIPLLINYYSFGYGGGYADKTLPLSSQFSISSLVNLALQNNLHGVELPFEKLLQADSNEVSSLSNSINNNSLEVLISIEDFTPQELFKVSEFLNSNRIRPHGIIRIKMSNNFGGNRYQIDDFTSQIKQFIDNIIEVDGYCTKMGYLLAIENHQDLTSYELIDIIESNNLNSVGINWDVGNSLALGQSPKDFYKVIRKHIINVHLKDYIIVETKLGSMLVRCPLGKGVVDFGQTITDLRLQSHRNNTTTMSVELGSHIPRTVDYFHPEYWGKFPESVQADKDKYIRYMQSHNIQKSDFQKNNLLLKSPSDIIKEEINDVVDSVLYIQSIMGMSS